MLFPELAQKKWAVVNLNLAAEKWFLRNQISGTDPNPLLDPATSEQMVRELHQELGVDVSYGGWLENRSSLWRGSYLDQAGIHLHLGVDFNVPAGTSVAAEHLSEVIRVDCDAPDEEGGWGTRVILRPIDGTDVLIYAHLAPDVFCGVGDQLEPGTVFATVGKAPFNGGWFSHLHVQCVTNEMYQQLLKNDLRDLDGYGLPQEADELRSIFKNPLNFVSLQ